MEYDNSTWKQIEVFKYNDKHLNSIYSKNQRNPNIMTKQGMISKLITGLLLLSLFISPAMCAEDFTVNVIPSTIALIIINVGPEDEIQLDINDGQRLDVYLNLSADTQWYVNGELVSTQTGSSNPFYYFTPPTMGEINITSSSTNIVSPFDTVTHTWLVSVHAVYYVISPVFPIIPPDEEEYEKKYEKDDEEDDEEKESDFVADIVEDITPPYTGIFNNNVVYVIENGIQSIIQSMTHMMTFVSTGNNWFSLMFGFLGIIIAGSLSKAENIVVDTILIGSTSIIAILMVNSIFSILTNDFIINSFIFLLSCGSIAMIMFNMKEIENIPHMLEA